MRSVGWCVSPQTTLARSPPLLYHSPPCYTDHTVLCRQGTGCFLGGLLLVFLGWVVVGMALELYGFLHLFRRAPPPGSCSSSSSSSSRSLVPAFASAHAAARCGPIAAPRMYARLAAFVSSFPPTHLLPQAPQSAPPLALFRCDSAPPPVCRTLAASRFSSFPRPILHCPSSLQAFKAPPAPPGSCSSTALAPLAAASWRAAAPRLPLRRPAPSPRPRCAASLSPPYSDRAL